MASSSLSSRVGAGSLVARMEGAATGGAGAVGKRTLVEQAGPTIHHAATAGTVHRSATGLPRLQLQDVPAAVYRAGGDAGAAPALTTAPAPAATTGAAPNPAAGTAPASLAVPAVATGGAPAPAAVIAAASRGGVPLPATIQALFGPRLGHDFSDVRVHTGSAAAAAARSIDARAYTVGRDIVFGEGQYQPDTRDGQHLLAHELTHVVQQGGSARRGGEATGNAPDGAATQLGRAIAQLTALHALVAPISTQPGNTEGAQHVAQLAAGLARLRAIVASGDSTAQTRALAELSAHLPPGMVDGIAGRAPASPAAAPPIVEQRAPSVAMASLTVSGASDPAEHEAERVADAVMDGAHVSVEEADGDVIHRAGGPGGEPSGGGGGDDWGWLPIFAGAVITICILIMTWFAWQRCRTRAPSVASALDTASKKVSGGTPPPAKQTAKPLETGAVTQPSTPSSDPSPQATPGDSTHAKPKVPSSSSGGQVGPVGPINRAPFRRDPIELCLELAGDDDVLLRDLVEQTERHGSERTAWAYARCGQNLGQTRTLLDTIRPFQGTAILDYLDATELSAETLEFLRSCGPGPHKLSGKVLGTRRKKWKKEQQRKQHNKPVLGKGASDDPLVSRYGEAVASWAKQLEVSKEEEAAAWIALADRKGGEPVRRFVTAHLSAKDEVRTYIERVPDDEARKRIASEWTREFATSAKHIVELPPGRREGEEVAHGGALPNNGTDCFLLAVCQVLSLPAYNGLALLQPVRAIVTKVQQRADFSAAEIQRLRTWLAQLGVVEQASGRHEDAAELLGKLLHGANPVRMTERHHIDQHEDGHALHPRLRPGLHDRVAYDGGGNRNVTTDAESMLQVPIANHNSLAAWLNSVHEQGVRTDLAPDRTRPSTYEWVSLGGQLRSVLRRTTRTSMHTLPATLTIMLKRFDNDGNKIGKPFTMPQTFAVTEEGAAGPRRKTYQLQAVIYHQGARSAGGHYWAHRRDAQRGWEKANDASVQSDVRTGDPVEGDVAHDVNHGYVYTYTAGPGVIVGGWQAATQTAFDGNALPEAADAEHAHDGGAHADKDKPKGADPTTKPTTPTEPASDSASDTESDTDTDPTPAKVYGKPDETVRKQRWYGLGSLINNRDKPTSADGAASPQTGALNEGPCAGIVTALIAEMLRSKIKGACMVGAVQSMSGGWFVTTSGTPPTGFRGVVQRTKATTGLSLLFIERGKIAKIHDDTGDRKYINSADVTSFSGQRGTQRFHNNPVGDSIGEAALGLPGTCALPKLLAHLISLKDPPQHASEKWFSTIDDNTVKVLVAQGHTKPTTFVHGDTVPSCKTCRPIVAHQLHGIGEFIVKLGTSAKLEAEQRLRDLARREAAYAAALDRYTKIALAHSAALSTPGSQVNDTYLDSGEYTQMQEAYRDLVRMMVADRLDALIAADDPRYTGATIDADDGDEAPAIDLGLAPLLEARQRAHDAPSEDRTSTRDDEEPIEASGKKAKSAKGAAKRSDKPKRSVKAKFSSRGIAPQQSGPTLREPTAADNLMLDILAELAQLNALWTTLPAELWTGAGHADGATDDTVSDDGEDIDNATVEQIIEIFAALREELCRIANSGG